MSSAAGLTTTLTMTATEVTRLNGQQDTFARRGRHQEINKPENYDPSSDKMSKADSPNNLRISIENINPDKTKDTSTSTTSPGAGTTAATGGKPEYPPPIKDYGQQWEWDPKAADYVRENEKGEKILYTKYQKPDAAQTPKPASANPTKQAVSKSLAWQGTLDHRFSVIAKPKRFFSVGRIFKVAWFEPRGQDTPVRRSSDSGPDWAAECPAFYGETPVAKFRWFVIVRRRLHHSLCFSITAYNRAAPNKTPRGRDLDYTVLYSSSVDPARPYDEENITREPIAVIIEEGETYIAPIARLDLGRIYTVEDNLKIMKVGRVHPSSLDSLEEYYQDSVL